VETDIVDLIEFSDSRRKIGGPDISSPQGYHKWISGMDFPALVGVTSEDNPVDIWFITWLAPLFPNNMFMEVDYYYK
jgi:hypothetical protein